MFVESNERITGVLLSFHSEMLVDDAGQKLVCVLAGCGEPEALFQPSFVVPWSYSTITRHQSRQPAICPLLQKASQVTKHHSYIL